MSEPERTHHRQHPIMRGTTWVILLAAAAAGGWFAVRQTRLAGGMVADAERLAAQVKTLEGQIADMTRQRDSLRRERGDLPPVVSDAAELAALKKEAADRVAADAAMIRQLKDAVAAAGANAGKMEARVGELQADLDRISQENDRRSASQVELGEKINGLNRIIAALERENKTKGDRLLQLELTNRQLHEENTRIGQKNSAAARVSSDLQELYRRREVYLNNILNRYRELTDQFRSISGMLESRGRQEGAAGAPDLGRIQNTISLTEDDMRQLGTLNAQVLQLQRKIYSK